MKLCNCSGKAEQLFPVTASAATASSNEAELLLLFLRIICGHAPLTTVSPQ